MRPQFTVLRILLVVAMAMSALLWPTLVHAQTSASTTETLSAAIAAEAGLFAFPNSMTLSRTGTVFNTFTGSLVVQYRARTSQSAGSGSLTVRATADFTPAGGPSIAVPPTAGDALAYTCSSATLGAACSGVHTVSTSTATNVVTIGAGSCTGASPCPSNTVDPNTVNLSFSLTNDPKYKTGSYSATLTFTISAT